GWWIPLHVGCVTELLEGTLGELREGRCRIDIPRLLEGGLGIVRSSRLGERQPEAIVGSYHDGLQLYGRLEGLDGLLGLAQPDVRLAHVVVRDLGGGVGGEGQRLLVGDYRIVELPLLGESDPEIVLKVGVVLVEVDGCLYLGLAINGTTQVEIDETQGVVELGIFGVELYRFLERGDAERETIVGQVAHSIVIAVLGLKLPHLLVLRAGAGREEGQGRRREDEGGGPAAPP